MDEPEKDNPENKEKDCDNKQEKKEVKQPLFSDEVFKDDLELGKDDLDKLPV